TPVNDAPTITVTATNDFTEDSGAAVGDIVASYTTFDEDGNPVTVTLSDTVNYALDGAGNVVLTQAGLDLVNSGADLPAFTLTPNDGIVDGTAATVDPAVTPVNDAPTITVTATNDFTEDSGAAVGDIVASYTTFDEDGNPVTVTLSDTVNYALDGAGNVVLTQAGLDLVNSGADLPAFTLTPNDGIVDGTAATVDPAVTPVNDAPVAVDDAVIVPQDVPFNSTVSLLANDTDVDSAPLTVQSFTIAGDTTVYTAGTTATITGVGTVQVNTDGSYTFTPVADYTGAVPLVTYTVSDGALTDTGVLTLTIDPLDAIDDTATLEIGNVTATVGPEVTTNNVQILGLAESSTGTDGSQPVDIVADYSVLHVEVSQEALVAVADGYRVDIVDEFGNIVASTNPNDPNLVGQVLTPIIGGALGVSGTNTMTADFVGLPAGTYTVVVHNDQNQLSRLLDSDGSGGVSLQELADSGVILGPENEQLVIDTVVSALNNPILGLDLGVGDLVGSLLTPILDGIVNTVGQETPVTALVAVLGDILNGLGLTSVLDTVLSQVSQALLANTLTLLQTTTITTQLTEYNLDPATSSITGNVIDDADPAGNDVLGNVGPTAVTEVSYTNAAGVTTTVTVDPTTGADIAGEYGTLHINADGSYTYTANGNPAILGPEDVFTYTLADDLVSDTATLTIDLTDTVAPTQIPSITAITTDTGTQGDWSTADNSPTIIGTLDTPLLPGETVQVSLDGGTTWVDAYMDPNDINGADGWTWFYGSNDLTVGTHTVVARVIDGSGNTGPTDTQVITIEGNQAPIAVVDGGTLGGLVGADVLGLTDVGSQTFAAYDFDNNLQSVTISYQPGTGLGAYTFAVSQALATELGISFTVTGGAAALVTTPTTMTITATDGGTLDNVVINEFLKAVYMATLLNLGVASTYRITVTDANGLTDTASYTGLLDVGLVSVAPGGMGTTGNDTVNGTSGNDNLYGFAGDDILRGGDGNDLLRGGTGADQLYGEDGDDLLIYDAADTVIDGGMGNDTLLITTATASILGYTTAVHDIETIQLGSETEAVTLTLGADGAATASGSGSQLFVEGDSYDTLNLIDGVYAGQVLINGQAYEQYTLDGTTVLVNPAVVVALQDSAITGTASDDTLNGTVESETLSGLDGNDILNGGAGNDILDGGAGNDILNGGAGNDTFIGGTGSDTAIYNVLDSASNTGGNGVDTWTDFHLGDTATDSEADVIDISDLLVGYAGDGSAVSLAGYISVSSDGTNTTLSIDRDGAGTTYATTDLLVLNNTDTTLDQLLQNNQIIF
uniref:beta strand repeat-containing protein n=1 Tax=Acinetobacter baumannii TaxID=470 RepID=UPI000D6909FC